MRGNGVRSHLCMVMVSGLIRRHNVVPRSSECRSGRKVVYICAVLILSWGIVLAGGGIFALEALFFTSALCA